MGDGTEKTPVAWGTNSGSKSTTNCSTYLHFTGDEERSCPHKLKILFYNSVLGQVVIKKLHPKIQCLVIEFKILLNLDKPINKDGSHGGSNVILPGHVRLERVQILKKSMKGFSYSFFQPHILHCSSEFARAMALSCLQYAPLEIS